MKFLSCWRVRWKRMERTKKTCVYQGRSFITMPPDTNVQVFQCQANGRSKRSVCCCFICFFPFSNVGPLTFLMFFFFLTFFPINSSLLSSKIFVSLTKTSFVYSVLSCSTNISPKCFFFLLTKSILNIPPCSELSFTVNLLWYNIYCLYIRLYVILIRHSNVNLFRHYQPI